MGVVLHELAHIIDIGPDEPDPPAELIAAGRRLLAADSNGSEPPSNGPGAAIPWRWHESGFIRTALHLAYRAAARGLDLSPTDVFAASDYDLSPTRRYAAALGDEPDRLAGLDFATIKSTPLPTALVDLWKADVQAWMSRHVTSDESSIALAACERRFLIPQA
jgi:hypothetical protein